MSLSGQPGPRLSCSSCNGCSENEMRRAKPCSSPKRALPSRRQRAPRASRIHPPKTSGADRLGSLRPQSLRPAPSASRDAASGHLVSAQGVSPGPARHLSLSKPAGSSRSSNILSLPCSSPGPAIDWSLLPEASPLSLTIWGPPRPCPGPLGTSRGPSKQGDPRRGRCSSGAQVTALHMKRTDSPPPTRTPVRLTRERPPTARAQPPR